MKNEKRRLARVAFFRFGHDSKRLRLVKRFHRAYSVLRGFSVLDESRQEKLDRLERLLGELRSVLVAYSGGVDSALLLFLAHRILGEKCLGLTAQSETVPRSELRDAIRVAEWIGANHVVVRSNELAVESYRTNPTNRCYFCKTELYSICTAEAESRGISWVLDGTNLDDLGDHRPGHKAAGEKGVRSPFVEVGLTKDDIRVISKEFSLETWKKAEFACLGSRFPYGTAITARRLSQIEACEEALRDAGFVVFRARYHDEVVRLELGEEELERVWDREIRQDLIQRCKEAGFRFVSIDLEGYRRGSLNRGLTVVPAERTLLHYTRREASADSK